MATRRIAPVLEQLEPRLNLSSIGSVDPFLTDVIASFHAPLVRISRPSQSTPPAGQKTVLMMPTGAPLSLTITSPAPGGLISGTAPTISGIAGTDPADSVVTVNVYTGTSPAGTPVSTLTAVANPTTGIFTVTPEGLPQGPYTVQASQSDGAGNTASSAPVSYTTYNTLPGDANGDGQINFADFTVLSNNFGRTVTGGPADGDFNFDGVVNFADFTILSNEFGQALLVKPSNVSLAPISSNSVQVSWTDACAIASGFQVYRSTDGQSYSLVASLPVSSTTFTDSGLAAGTTYFYQIAAYNGAGQSVSAPSSVATLPPSADPVNIYTKSMTSFTELDIDGTPGNDSIFVSQSGTTLNITANGQAYAYANTFGDLVIRGFAGNDSITVDSSVNIATLIYGGDGNNTLVDQTSGKATIVSIGDGVNTLTGNGINTSYWCNPGDTVNASAIEIADGAVNRVGSFYQPFTDSVVPRELYGQTLVDPTDSGSEHVLSADSFWGTGPVMGDVNQGTIGDCYFLAPLASLANNETLEFMNTGVDLGDGTYAVRFERSGVTTFVRVDGELSNFFFAQPGPTGDIWAMIYEKAYAFFRTGADTYASLNDGFQGTTFSDLGFSYVNIAASNSGSVILNTINNALSGGFALAAGSMPIISNGAPLVSSHCYSVIGAYVDGTGTVMIQLRNPWGIDGGGAVDPANGLLAISYADFAANFYSLTYTNS